MEEEVLKEVEEKELEGMVPDPPPDPPDPPNPPKP